MLNQPVSMLIPQVIGVRLSRHAARRLDLHRPRAHDYRNAAQGRRGRQVCRVLRARPAHAAACGSRDHRQHGARVRRNLRYLPDRCRDSEVPGAHRPFAPNRLRWSRPTAKSKGCSTLQDTPEASYTKVLQLDLSSVEPSVAGPKRPQDRVYLGSVGKSFAEALPGLMKPSSKAAAAHSNGDDIRKNLHHGSVVIAAITSCTNTSNPSVMIAAGLLAKKAVERGLSTPPWVKTSLGARIESGHRVLRCRGSDALSRKAAL